MQSTKWVLVGLAILMVTPCKTFSQDESKSKQQDESKSDKPQIEWAMDLESAQKQSQKDGRPVIAYFTYDGCVWCKRLEKACFYDPNVVKQSRRFIWVKVDRDETPEIPKKLNVSAYPSLLTLGKELENVYRFQSYQEPKEFIGNLDSALKRFEVYAAGKDWVVAPERSDRIIEQGLVVALNAPSDAVPGGITVAQDSIWVAQGKLFQLDAKSGKVLAKHSLPASIGDLCSDGKHLFGLTYGWTAGKPIYVIDPATGKVVREIVTEANKKTRSHGAKGIAFQDGHLFVLSGMVGKVFKIDPASGEVVDEIQLEGKWLSGLDFHQTNLIAGGRTQVSEFDSKTGALIRKFDCNYPVRNIADDDGTILLMEQPVFGFGRKHERIQVWPQETKIYRWSPAKKSKKDN